MPRSSRRHARVTSLLALSPVFALATLGVAAVAAAGCVTPINDYNDWVSRTADARGGGPVVNVPDAGSYEGGAPTQAFNQIYFEGCNNQLLGSLDPSQWTRFTATLTYTPNADGSPGGSLYFFNQTIAINATTLSQTVGTSASESNIQVRADGTCDVNFGQTFIAGAADPLGQDVTLTTVQHMILRAPPDMPCTNFEGEITAPVQQALDPTKNFCIFIPVSDGNVPTGLTADMLHCP